MSSTCRFGRIILTLTLLSVGLSHTFNEVNNAYAEVNSAVTAQPISDMELYQICSEAVSSSQFDRTPCAIYLQAFVSAYRITFYGFIPYLEDLKEEDGRELYYRYMSCDLSGKADERKKYDLKNIAEAYIAKMDKHIEMRVKRTARPELSDPSGMLWNYLFNCGSWKEIDSQAETKQGVENAYKSSANEKILGPLEQRCKELSQQGKHEYQVISGEVIRAGVTPQSPSDCFEIGCSQKTETSFSAVLIPLENASGQKMEVYTKKEPLVVLEKKRPYFETGKEYAFCAREIDPYPLKPNWKMYEIDDIGTIQTLN